MPIQSGDRVRHGSTAFPLLVLSVSGPTAYCCQMDAAGWLVFPLAELSPWVHETAEYTPLPAEPAPPGPSDAG